MLARLSRRACAYHNEDSSGKLYDSNGHVCEALSSEDKLFLAIALSVCGLVLLILAGIGLSRLYKVRSRERASRLAAEPKMSSMGTPLIRHAGNFASMSGGPSRALLTPLPSASSSSDHDENLYSDASSPGSPYSPQSETFHFPILSADGHLLPPPPASARQAIVESRSYDHEGRPLPAAPIAAAAPLYAPVPKSSQRWSYRTPSEESTLQAGGLYAGMEIGGDGVVGLVGDTYDRETTNIRTSPAIPLPGYSHHGYAPQTATYHLSPPVEGDDFSIYDYASEEGYRQI